MRVVAPFAGNDRGIQFFPEIGDEIAVAFEEGDPARPYALGGLWNGKDAPPDLKYKQIVTKSGNVVRISDESNKESIQIFTPNGACMVQLQNDSSKPTITVHSEGDISLEAKEELRIKCKNLVQVVDQDYQRKAGKSEKAAAGADMTLTAAQATFAADGNMAVSAGGNMDVSGMMTNVVGTLVQLNPPVFVKMPVMKAQPNVAATQWGKQPGARQVTKLKNTYDPIPPRGLAAATGVASKKTETTKPAFAPTTTDEKTFVEVQMVGSDDKPIAGVKYQIELPDGSTRVGVTNENGMIRYEGIDPGECKVTFPELDKDAWEPA
jgi:type VI secretion system secreted protein VgrG